MEEVHICFFTDFLNAQLEETGRDVNYRDDFGYTALHIAAERDLLEAAKWLINVGADLEARDINNATALHVAAWKDSLRVATLLVEEGADVSLKNSNGRTPLHWSAYFDSIKVARLLLNKSCDETNARDIDNNTPLMLAKSQNSENVLQLFQAPCHWHYITQIIDV